MSTDRFSHSQYLIRRKILRILGGAFHVYDPSGNLLFYCDMKRLKIREDIRVYSDEAKSDEVLHIQARHVFDISTTYDVFESKGEQRIGSIKRKGLRSVLRDEWVIMDATEREIAIIQEDSMLMALLRRFLSNLIPQRFHVDAGGRTIATFQQNFNPFLLKITADFTADSMNVLDRRLGLAAGLLLSAIEGRQG